MAIQRNAGSQPAPLVPDLDAPSSPLRSGAEARCKRALGRRGAQALHFSCGMPAEA
jgi:hypothetical protein